MRQFGGKTGFTLIETLVVMAIIAVLSAMLIAYNHSSTTQLALTADTATVASALNRAKALALEKYRSGGSEVCAYGVTFFKNGKYFIYGYTPPLGQDCSSGPSHWGGSIIVQQLQLDSGVSFSGVSSAVAINFIPPYLEATSSGAMSVTLKTAAGQTATVSVSPAGAVSF